MLKFVNFFDRLITSLPMVNQHLLVLLFGTFQTIASAADRERNGMTSEALGISVAPSFFHSCISEGCKTAKMEDIQRYKVSTIFISFLMNVCMCVVVVVVDALFILSIPSIHSRWIVGHCAS